MHGFMAADGGRNWTIFGRCVGNAAAPFQESNGYATFIQIE